MRQVARRGIRNRTRFAPDSYRAHSLSTIIVILDNNNEPTSPVAAEPPQKETKFHHNILPSREYKFLR